MPCPRTSPTTRATRAPESGITSYQSPAQAGQLVGGPVAGGHLDRVLLGQPARQQAALEDERGVPLAGVAAGVVHADGGPRDELLGERQVVRRRRARAAAAAGRRW